MHNNWEELIPYYIAGTLPKADTARLERHLAGCDECRSSLDEWRSIAGAVRDMAASQLRDLPPLSAQLMRLAEQQASSRQMQGNATVPLTPIRSVTRRRSMSITLVAALVTVILFGGLLMFAALLSKQLQTAAQTTVLLPSATPTEIAQGAPLLTPSESPEPQATESPAPQVVVIEPSQIVITPSPLPTLLFLPTFSSTQVLPTPIPPTRRPNVIVPTAVLITAAPPPTDAPTSASPQTFSQMAVQACTLQAAVPGSVVNLYDSPSTDSAIVRTLSSDDHLTVLGKSDNGWYRAQYEPGSSPMIGWVQQEKVVTSGNCDSLPIITVSPTPTLSPTATNTVLPFMPTLTPSDVPAVVTPELTAPSSS